MNCDCCALQLTDKCNVEYEAQLNGKHEKMREQLRHLEVLQQNIVQLNHQLENNGSKGINAAGEFGVLRQSANYRSLPLGTKLQSFTDQTADHRTSAQHCKDMLSTHMFDVLTTEDKADSSKSTCVDSSQKPSDSNSINLSVTAVGEVPSSGTFPPVNSGHWNLNTGIGHSENLRNTSYRMIGRFASQQADVYQSKQLVDTYLPAGVDHNIPSLRSADITDRFPVTVESVHMTPSCTVNETSELEQLVWSKDVSPSPHKADDIGSVVSDISGQLSRPAEGCSELVLLPDIIGSASTVSAASQLPPPVAQKSRFQYPGLSHYGVRSYDKDDTMVNCAQNTSICDSAVPYDMGFTIAQNLASERLELKNISGELPQSNSDDSIQREAFSGDGQWSLTESNRLFDRPTYKPSLLYPVRRRWSVREQSEFSSTSLSSEVQGKTDTAAVTEDSPISSEGHLSKAQTVKNKLRVGMSRRVQFEPLALLLDAAIEGEIDLLQTTLKVRKNYSGFQYCIYTS